jgi:hypothetical protein
MNKLNIKMWHCVDLVYELMFQRNISLPSSGYPEDTFLRNRFTQDLHDTSQKMAFFSHHCENLKSYKLIIIPTCVAIHMWLLMG